MKKLIFVALCVNAVLVADRMSRELPIDASGARNAGESPCAVDRAQHSIDANADGGVDVSDALYLLNWLFSGGPAPQSCLARDPGCNQHVIECGASASTITDTIDRAVEGDSIVFRPGVYDLSSWTTKVIDKELHFFGSRGATTLRGPSRNAILFDLKAPASFEGLTFDRWAIALRAQHESKARHMTIRDCRFTNIDTGSTRHSAVFSSSVRAGVERLVVTGCEFDTIGKNGIEWEAPFENARIESNRFTHVGLGDGQGSAAAIQLGDNQVDKQDMWKNAIIARNYINNVTSASGDSHGVLFYGREVSITDNHILNIDTLDTVEYDDTEGIYTKCRRGIISGNVLVDAGRQEGAITMKGSLRSESSAPQGFAILCTDNQVFFSSNTRVRSTGIKIAAADVLVARNFIEGTTANAISTFGGELDNVAILRNHIRNVDTSTEQTSVAAINLELRGDHVSCCHNLIQQVSAFPGKAVLGISVRPRCPEPCQDAVTPRDWDVSHNVIASLSGDPSGGVRVWGDRGIDGLRIDGNRLRNIRATETEEPKRFGIAFGTSRSTNVRVEGNDFVDVGDPITWTVLYAPVGRRVRNNRGYESSGVTFPDGEAMPRVVDEDAFYVMDNSQSTTITGFLDGYDGQTITVHFKDNLTSVASSPNVVLSGGAPFDATEGSVLVLQQRGGIWYETGRSKH